MNPATILALVLLTQTSEIEGVSLADLPAYAAALKTTNGDRPAQVTFRELWSEPKSYRGRTVEVSGRVARIFRAPAQGELPPRIELWIAQGTNLLCVVLPDRSRDGELVREGGFVSISGTSLGVTRYSGGDVERLAPLIVGPGPARLVNDATSSREPTNWTTSVWSLAVIGSLIVAGFLARAHSRRPSGPRPISDDGVEFDS